VAALGKVAVYEWRLVHLLPVFSSEIFRTVVQQLTRFQLHSASRGPSAIVELLVHPPLNFLSIIFRFHTFSLIDLFSIQAYQIARVRRDVNMFLSNTLDSSERLKSSQPLKSFNFLKFQI